MNFEEVLLKKGKGKPINYDQVELKITNSTDLTSMEGIQKFSKLKTLELNNVPNLKNVTDLPESLRILICGNDRDGQSLRSADIHTIDKFPSKIEEIYLGNNIRLKEIPAVPATCTILQLYKTKVSEFAGGKGLVNLNIRMTNFKEFEDAVTKYPMLEKLYMGDTYIRSLTNLPRLKVLHGLYSGKKRIESLNYLDLSNQRSEYSSVDFHLTSDADAKGWVPNVEINWGDWSPTHGKFFGRTTSDIFVEQNLNKTSDRRGEASILDTGLFDFI